MMSEIYVLGGRAKKTSRKKYEWEHFEKGVILRVDTDTHAVESVVEYVSPPDACPDKGPSLIFKAGSLEDGLLYACTQTEILVYGIPDFDVQKYISLPLFNDIHHVTPTREGTLLVAVTGLDMVIEMSMEGNVLREWDTLGEPLWQRFSRDVDYRKVPTTKPHKSHPNFVFLVDGEIWVTRCIQKDAVCMNAEKKDIKIAIELPHDGVLFGDKLFFTTVDGHIVIADCRTQEIVEVVDIRSIVQSDRPLGWCRAIKVIGDDRVIVGYSRLRPTTIEKNVQWVKRQVKTMTGIKGNFSSLPSMPTRVSCVDLTKKQIIWDINLEDHGMNAVFSIL